MYDQAKVCLPKVAMNDDDDYDVLTLPRMMELVIAFLKGWTPAGEAAPDDASSCGGENFDARSNRR